MAVIDVTEQDFEREVIERSREIPVVVDFWAEWCGPCRMVAPVLEKLATEYQGKARIGKVNVDEQSSLAARYGIQSIPTMLLFKNGKVVEQYVGAAPREVLAKLLDKHVAT